MSREFPDFIDPWRAAEGNRSFAGTIPLARMKRLAPLLESVEGEARFEASFAYDQQRRATVLVEVDAPLTLMCQRSLEPYRETVRQRSLLQIISDLSEQAFLSEQEESVLAQEGHLAILELVEDELLLAVPQVPRKPEAGGADSDEADRPREEPTQRPFANLADMMKNR